MTGSVPVCTVRSWEVRAGTVVARATTAAAGDLRVDGDPQVLARRRDTVERPAWTWLRQVHGAEVVTVTEPGGGAGATADAAVTVQPDCPLAVTTADCAPLVLVAEAGFGVVHAGWRGAEAGVIAATAERLEAMGAGAPVASWLGPCIGPEAYEFGAEPLERLVDRFGPSVAARTATGAPALDLRAVVRSACSQAGWPVPPTPPCTSDPRWFSHRTRGDVGRQATVAVLRSSRA